MKKLLKAVFDFLYGMILKGLIVKLFYGWFVLSVFTVLPKISYLQAIGLGVFLHLFNSIKPYELELHKTYEDSDNVKYGKYVIPLIILGLGYVTHLIMVLFS